MSGDLEHMRAFIAAWERSDLEEIMGFFAEDRVNHDVPIEPAREHRGHTEHRPLRRREGADSSAVC